MTHQQLFDYLAKIVTNEHQFNMLMRFANNYNLSTHRLCG